ncbi:MalY/PatB family protein [Schaalia vaccimaxillae]|uniref:MalY/PatB family protein n=1 Tax=Schaalia vaccimaxillae TaxID=183916 RepID=UPI0003B399B8|nr:aminotransferase class I/II-fold pyridoxal phosphate-dependent enzyme [Schaalia vaccimaxillae]
MSVRIFSEEELRDTASLKWSGITTSNGDPTIGAWVAEMDFATAPTVAERMKKAIDDGLLGYQPTWLAGAVAEATSAFQLKRFGWSVPADQVRLVASVLPALRATISHLVRPGAPIIVPTPAYMPFLTIPGQLDHPVIEVPSLHGEAAQGRGWTLNLEGIKDGLEAGAGLVVLCNPWNPTGRVLSEEELRALGDLVSQYDALVFSDEIHSPLILTDTPFLSYARLDPTYAAHTVTATAASKGWNIAGLPSAQVILPDEQLCERWDEFGAEVRFEASVIGSLGTIAAYENGDDWQRKVLDIITGNVAIVEQGLAGTGIDFTRPEGTYLTWWGFQNLGLPSSPATILRDRARVAANDGKTLGAGYEQWARINLACSTEVAHRIVDAVVSTLG